MCVCLIDHDGPTTQGEQHGHFSGVQLKRHLLQVSTNGSQHNPKWTVKPFDEVYPGIFLGDVYVTHCDVAVLSFSHEPAGSKINVYLTH